MLACYSIKLVVLILFFTSATKGQDYPGKLRLVNDTDTYSSAGRLEIFHNNRWNSICTYGFGYYEATLACKQLGYRTYQRYGTVGTLGFSPASRWTPVWAAYISCSRTNPDHLTLYQCPRSSAGWCSHTYDVALECSLPYSTESSSVIFSTSEVDNNTDATFLTAGRVDIFFAGQWGTICSDGFTLSDAQGLCHIMTGSHSVMAFGPVGSDNLEFDEGLETSPIWINNFHCTYYSSHSRYYCTHDGLGNTNNCSHDRDLALSCLADGATRLVSESSPSSNDPGGSAGRLEIYHSGQWGTVCNDSFDQTDADVVCKQLGYVNAINFGSVGELGYSQGTGSIWLTNVRCTSDDIFLANCSHSGLSQVRSCTHSEDVAISCLRKSGINAITVTENVVTTPGTVPNSETYTRPGSQTHPHTTSNRFNHTNYYHPTTPSHNASTTTSVGGAIAGVLIVAILIITCIVSIVTVLLCVTFRKRTNNNVGQIGQNVVVSPPPTTTRNNLNQHYQMQGYTTQPLQVAPTTPPPFQMGAPQQHAYRYRGRPTDRQYPHQEIPRYTYPPYGQYVPPPAQIPPAQIPPTQMPPPQMPPPQMPPAQIHPAQMPPPQMPPAQIPPAQMPPAQMPPAQTTPDQIPPAQIPPPNQCTPVQGNNAPSIATAPVQQQHQSNPAAGGLKTYYIPFKGDHTNKN